MTAQVDGIEHQVQGEDVYLWQWRMPEEDGHGMQARDMNAERVYHMTMSILLCVWL